MPIALKAFDPSRDFIAATSFRAAGVIWSRKKPFDKSVVSERVLRQLYEARKITYPRPAAQAAPVAEPLVNEDDPIDNHDTEVKENAAEQSAISEESDKPEGEAADGAAPTTGEAAVAPAGDSATAAAGSDKEAADRAAKIDQLMVDNSQAALLKLAAGLPSVNSKTPKKALATMLVDAARAGG